MSRLTVMLALALVSCACQGAFDAAIQRGDAAALAGKWPQARDAFAAAVKVNDQSALAHSRLGAAAWNAGDRPLAVKAWGEALARDGSDAVALEGLARASLEAGDAGAAVSALDQVSAPTGALRLTLARSLLARGGAGDAARALELSKAALADAPADAHALYLLGSAQIAVKTYADAQATFDALLRQGGGAALGNYGLARLAAAQSRQTDALLYLGAAQTAAGSSWNSERVAADPAFAFLAQTSEFKSLVGK